jgi:ligand-binding sensor domain-containing protein
VWALYKDKQGTIWVGTYHGGVNYFNPKVNYYTYHDLQKGCFINKPFPVISDMAVASNGHIFLCTEGNGLIDYEPESRTYVNYMHSPVNPNSLSGDNIKTAYLDQSTQKLWLGMHLGGLTLFDIPEKRFSQYKEIKPEWEQSNIVRAIVPYQGNLLVATYNGLFSFSPTTGKFTLFSEKLHKIVQYFVDIKLDNKNNLWIAGNDLVKYDLATGNYIRYTHIPDND